MTDENSTHTNSFGKWFGWLAWALFIGAITFAFNDFLEHKHNPNQVLTSYQRGDEIQVVLQRNSYGHYVTSGQINQTKVTFMLDTGATSVSIPEHIAKQIGLEKQRSYFVNTANGQAKVYQTKVDTLRIGEIILYNVAAHINPSFDGDEILLGMSALKQIEFRQKGKTLTLIHYK